MDREVWRAAVHGVAKSRTWLSDRTELNWKTSLPLGELFGPREKVLPVENSFYFSSASSHSSRPYGRAQWRVPWSFFFFITWRLITLQYCSGFCHTLTWISHGFTCVPHPDPPSQLPLHPIPLALPSAPGPSSCLMHPTWASDLFHPNTCFDAVLSKHPTLAFSYRVQKSVLYICVFVSILHIGLLLASF